MRARGWDVARRVGRTGADGRIVLARAADERLDVTVFLSAPQALSRTLVGHLEATTGGEIRLAPKHQELAIRAMDGDGPAARLLVTAGPEGWPLGFTDAGGRWTGSDPWLGNAQLGEARSEAGLVLVAADGRRWFGGAPESPTVAQLPAAPGISGRVLEAGSRRPLAGAIVWYGHDPGAYTLSDAEGRYRIPAAAGESFWVQAEAAGHLPRYVRLGPEQLAAGRAPSMALPLSTAVRGKITDGRDRPLAGAVVDAVVQGRRLFFSSDAADARASSTGDGTFRLTGIEPGRTYQVRASLPGYATSVIEVPPSGLAAGAPDLKLVLTSARGRLRSRPGRRKPTDPEGRGHLPRRQPTAAAFALSQRDRRRRAGSQPVPHRSARALRARPGAGGRDRPYGLREGLRAPNREGDRGASRPASLRPATFRPWHPRAGPRVHAGGPGRRFPR